MKTLYTIALFRSDLGDAFKDTPLDEILLIMFPFFNTGVVLHEDLIIFIDDGGRTIILKNRYGNK
jgi:hypothetical protein